MFWFQHLEMGPVFAVGVQHQFNYCVAQCLGWKVLVGLLVLSFGLNCFDERFGVLGTDRPGVVNTAEHIEPVTEVLFALLVEETLQSTVLIGMGFPLGQIISNSSGVHMQASSHR